MIKSMRLGERCSVALLQNFERRNGNLMFFLCGAGGGVVTDLSVLRPRSSSAKTRSMHSLLAGGGESLPSGVHSRFFCLGVCSSCSSGGGVSTLGFEPFLVFPLATINFLTTRHSSVECPLFLWYLQYFPRSTSGLSSSVALSIANKVCCPCVRLWRSGELCEGHRLKRLVA